MIKNSYIKYNFITIKQIGNESWHNKPVYRVFNNKTDNQIAIITYYNPYKKYVFESREGCIFANTCLRDIIDFLENKVVEE